MYTICKGIHICINFLANQTLLHCKILQVLNNKIVASNYFFRLKYILFFIKELNILIYSITAWLSERKFFFSAQY